MVPKGQFIGTGVSWSELGKGIPILSHTLLGSKGGKIQWERGLKLQPLLQNLCLSNWLALRNRHVNTNAVCVGDAHFYGPSTFF